MSYWFHDRPFTPNYKVVAKTKYGPLKSGAAKHNVKVHQIEELKEQGTAGIGALSKRDLWMLGIGVYIGEGAKSIESVRIMNSDPAVIALSIRWFKEVCGLVDEDIISMNLYPDNDIEECRAY